MERGEGGGIARIYFGPSAHLSLSLLRARARVHLASTASGGVINSFPPATGFHPFGLAAASLPRGA